MSKKKIVVFEFLPLFAGKNQLKLAKRQKILFASKKSNPGLGYGIVNIFFSFATQMTIIFVINTSNNLRINKIYA